MSQSLANVLIHIVFSTKNRYPYLAEKEIRDEMHSYLGGACNNLGCRVIRVGGASDHIHILCRLSRSITAAKLIAEIKRESSRWIKTKGKMLSKFSWQNGYGIFSVSESETERVKNYISNQEKHHQKKEFKEEYRTFLRAYEVNYNEKYMWD